MPQLSAAQYGKDNIRVYKVHKDPKTGVHNVVEMTVCVLLRGDIETSYVNFTPVDGQTSKPLTVF